LYLSVFPYSAEHLHNHSKKIASTATTLRAIVRIPGSALTFANTSMAGRREREALLLVSPRWSGRGPPKSGRVVTAPMRALRFDLK
jgi:hypothetical protein